MNRQKNLSHYVFKRDETPASLGFRMPAEWEGHEGTWLSWPKDPVTFPGKAREAVEGVFIKAVKALQMGEKVFILADNEDRENYIRDILQTSGVSSNNIFFHKIKSVDVWIRDYGPTFVKNRQTNTVAVVKWKFNAWGGKYKAFMPDDRAGMEVARHSKVQIFKPDIVMEGGAIESNGEGTILTTEQCLLNKNRNPGLTKTQIEDYLKHYLGAHTIIWLKEGIEGDDTDGHVDDIARFVGKNRVLCALENDKRDKHNYQALNHNYKLLQKAKTSQGEKLEIIKLPMPEPILFPKRPFAGPRLPLSYANFYIGNTCIIIPVFGCKTDDKALSIMQGVFPDREIVPVYSLPFVYGSGAIHCATQQQPKS
ncbi:MAG: agmatine deiminase family protein [Nitrospinae bacterium]|nr:agmatine deiminase family protein [Nitrospinota bacterium]